MTRLFLISLLSLLSYHTFAQDNTTLSIHSNSSHVLFINCANSVAITLSSCSNSISQTAVKFVSPNATITIDSIIKNTFHLTIIPTGDLNSLNINVYEYARLIGSETFTLKNLPAPEIKVTTGGKQIDSKNGFYGLPKNLTIEAEISNAIQNLISINVEYKITNFEITFVTDAKKYKKINVDTNTIDVQSIKNIETTKYIMIQINEIKIILPDGKLSNEIPGNTIITIPIVH